MIYHKGSRNSPESLCDLEKWNIKKMKYQKKWNDVTQGSEHLRALENRILKKIKYQKNGISKKIEYQKKQNNIKIEY